MKEAIIIVVSDNFGGLGDFLFALKAVESLRHQYAAKSEAVPPIYLVTQPSGKEKIHKLKGNVEFDVEVLTSQDLHQKVRSQGDDRIVVGHVIEGPVLSNNLIEKVDAAINQINVPLITTGEYGDRDHITLTENIRHRSKELSSLRWVGHIHSGFNNTRSECGIMQRAKLVSRQEAILYLNNNIKNALGLQNETFFSQNEISLQYSHDHIETLSGNRVQDNPAQRFLELHRSFYKKSTKNQFVIMIGKALEYKFSALKTLQQFLINDGFQKIVFHNTVNHQETILHVSGKPGKQYKVLYYEGLTYQSMINCIAVSGPLMGVTGDQSFAEALQYEKIPVYETIEHKMEFIADYEQRLYDISGKDPVIEKCLEILRPLAAPSGQRRTNTSKDDGAYLHLHQSKLREINQTLLKQANLGDALYGAEIKAFKKELLQRIVESIISKTDYATGYYNEYRHKLFPDNDTEIVVFSALVQKVGVTNMLECFYQRKKDDKASADMADYLISLYACYDNQDTYIIYTVYHAVFISLITNQEHVCLQSILSQTLPEGISDAFYCVATRRDENNVLYFAHLSTLKGLEITRMYVKAMYACTEKLLHDILTETIPDQTIKDAFGSLKKSFLRSLASPRDTTKQTEAHDALIGLFLLEIGKRKAEKPHGFLSSTSWALSQRGRRHKNLPSSAELVLTGLGINYKQLPHDESHYTQQYEIFMVKKQLINSIVEDKNRFYHAAEQESIDHMSSSKKTGKVEPTHAQLEPDHSLQIYYANQLSSGLKQLAR